MVPRSRNAMGLRTHFVLADPPCVHREGLTRASQKCLPSVEVMPRLWLVHSLKPDTEPKQVHNCVKAPAWSLRCVNVGPYSALCTSPVWYVINQSIRRLKLTLLAKSRCGPEPSCPSSKGSPERLVEHLDWLARLHKPALWRGKNGIH